MKRKLLKEVICQLADCDEERMNELEKNIIVTPCYNIFENRSLSCGEQYRLQLEHITQYKNMFYMAITNNNN